MKPNEKGTMIQDTSVYREDLVVAEIIYNPEGDTYDARGEKKPV